MISRMILNVVLSCIVGKGLIRSSVTKEMEKKNKRDEFIEELPFFVISRRRVTYFVSNLMSKLIFMSS